MSKWPYVSSGIPDEEFIRGNLPMTKEEVRAVTISKLRLKKDSIVYDIGAGTGSLTIEAALMAREGKIYAIEKEKEGIRLISENITKFAVDNVVLVDDEAPEALKELPPVNRVIIGGSGGRLGEILKLVDKKLLPEGRIVINAITINTLLFAFNSLKEMQYRFEICNLAVTKSKKVGQYQMLKALNPIYIISGEKGV